MYDDPRKPTIQLDQEVFGSPENVKTLVLYHDDAQMALAEATALVMAIEQELEEKKAQIDGEVRARPDKYLKLPAGKSPTEATIKNYITKHPQVKKLHQRLQEAKNKHSFAAAQVAVARFRMRGIEALAGTGRHL